MKKNLLSCLVAASLVFGVGLGTVKNVMANEADPGPGEQPGNGEVVATTTEAPTEAPATTTEAPTEAPATTTEAPTTTAEATTTTTTVAAEVAAVAERKAAKDDAQSAWEAAEAKRCDFTLKASDKQRALFGKKMAELKKLIDAFDVTKIEDEAGLKALVTTMNSLLGYTHLYGTEFMPTEEVAGTPDSATEFNNLLHKLQDKLAEANELLAATEITDMKDKTFLKYFGCYTAEQIKKGVHLQNLKGLREAINEATPYVTCDTEVLAPKIKYEIAALQAYLDVAGKCKPVQPADPGKFVPGKSGKATPALPATGEVATALPLVLFASASVLTALRKKH